MSRIYSLILCVLVLSSNYFANAADILIDVKTSANAKFVGAPIKVRDSSRGIDISLVTNAEGVATLTNAQTGRYIITPMASRITFSPASAIVDLTSINKSVSFIADIGNGAASGKIVDENGLSINDAAVYTGLTGWAPTNDAAAFAIGNLNSGVTSLLPIVKCSGFSPAQRTANITSSGQIVSNANFTRTSVGKSSVWGQIKQNDEPLKGVLVDLQQNGITKFSGTTDENGYYIIHHVPVGQYAIVPQKQNFAFAPKSKELNITTCDIYSQQNFISGSSDDRYTVSGKVLFNGAPLAGATVIGGTSANNNAGYVASHGTTTTALDGTFQFSDYKFYESAFVFILQSGYRTNPARLEQIITKNTTVEFIARKTQCNDGIDNDNDGEADYPGDYGCLSIDSDSESLRIPECQDGLDNDNDGFADLTDRGCSTAQDNSERDPQGAACDNGSDDDNDALADYPADPGCSSAQDELETSALTACDDGIDNDTDGLTDLSDPGCANAADPSEQIQTSACDDGIDNDNDGLSDLNDPGCESPVDSSEKSDKNAKCDDGIDNDNDGASDLADKGCVDAFDGDESDDNQCTKYFTVGFQNTLSEGTGRLKAIGYEMAKRLDFAARTKVQKKHMKNIKKLYDRNVALVYSLPSVNLICADSCNEINNLPMIASFRSNVDAMTRYIEKLSMRYYSLKGFNVRNKTKFRSLKLVKKLRSERAALLKVSVKIPEKMRICSPN